MDEDLNLLKRAKYRFIYDIVQQVNNMCSGVGTVLILDEVSAKIINTFITMAELTENGIVVVENINRKRKDYPNFRAIYFLVPEKRNFEIIQDDFSNKSVKYANLHIFFTKKVPNEEVGYLKSMSFIQRTMTMKEVNLHVNLFNDHCFELYDQVNKTEVHVDALISILSHIEQINSVEVIRLANSLHKESETLSKLLDYRIKELLPYIIKDGTDNVKLFIFDRNVDLVTPLTHNFHYECLLTDLLNDFKLSQKSPDFVYKKYRHKFIKDCILGIGSDFERFLEENPVARIQRNNDHDVNMDKMGILIRGMNEYNEYVKTYELHLEYIKLLNNEVGQKGAKELTDLEYTLITGVDEYGEAVDTATRVDTGQKYLDSHEGEKSQQIRLLLILHGSLYKDFSSRLTAIEDPVFRDIFNKYIQLVANYGKYWPEKEKENLKKMTKDRYQIVDSSLQRYISKVEYIVSHYLKQGKSDMFETSCYGEKSSKLPKSVKSLFKGNINLGKAKRSNRNYVIIYILGGISFAEIQALKNLETTLGQNWFFLFGGDKILNSNSFIEWINRVNV